MKHKINKFIYDRPKLNAVFWGLLDRAVFEEKLYRGVELSFGPNREMIFGEPESIVPIFVWKKRDEVEGNTQK